ncbi:MAG: CheR family methyltransferase [Methylococcales bacterium]
MTIAHTKAHPSTATAAIRADEFDWISRFLNERTGILLKEGKQAMVMGRLEKRLRMLNLDNYGDYFHRLGKPGEETETRLAIDLLTTNETYFFRESQHFDFLRTQVFPKHPLTRSLRVWSAASSSGEEAYTLAFLLAEHLSSGKWEIIGTDISSRMLEKARDGLYQMSAAEKIPSALLKKYCLKGRDEYEGFLQIDPALRKRVKFQHANLVEALPDLGMFDVIFLRNVMIYFEQETKQQVIDRLQSHLLPGGHFIISHSESLNGLKTKFKMLMPSIYQNPL